MGIHMKFPERTNILCNLRLELLFFSHIMCIFLLSPFLFYVGANTVFFSLGQERPFQRRCGLKDSSNARGREKGSVGGFVVTQL